MRLIFLLVETRLYPVGDLVLSHSLPSTPFEPSAIASTKAGRERAKKQKGENIKKLLSFA